MPKMAKRMGDTCIIRSLNTKNGDHGAGARLMMRGRMDDPSLGYPDLGAVLARELGQAQAIGTVFRGSGHEGSTPDGAD